MIGKVMGFLKYFLLGDLFSAGSLKVDIFLV